MPAPLVTPDPPLTDGDILLRPFLLDDAAAIAEACRDEEITRFTFMPEGFTEDQAHTWIERSEDRWREGHARFAVVDARSDELLGQIGMAVAWFYGSAEAYYWLTAAARGRGVVTRALGMMADWAFDVVGIERLYLLVLPENERSHLVAERCGFTREGTLRAYERFKGGRPDLVSWSLLPADPRPWHALFIRPGEARGRAPE